MDETPKLVLNSQSFSVSFHPKPLKATARNAGNCGSSARGATEDSTTGGGWFPRGRCEAAWRPGLAGAGCSGLCSNVLWGFHSHQVCPQSVSLRPVAMPWLLSTFCHSVQAVGQRWDSSVCHNSSLHGNSLWYHWKNDWWELGLEAGKAELKRAVHGTPGRVSAQGPGVCTRGSLSVILGLSDFYLCSANPDVLQVAQDYLVQM